MKKHEKLLFWMLIIGFLIWATGIILFIIYAVDSSIEILPYFALVAILLGAVGIVIPVIYFLKKLLINYTVKDEDKK